MSDAEKYQRFPADRRIHTEAVLGGSGGRFPPTGPCPMGRLPLTGEGVLAVRGASGAMDAGKPARVRCGHPPADARATHPAGEATFSPAWECCCALDRPPAVVIRKNLPSAIHRSMPGPSTCWGRHLFGRGDFRRDICRIRPQGSTLRHPPADARAIYPPVKGHIVPSMGCRALLIGRQPGLSAKPSLRHPPQHAGAIRRGRCLGCAQGLPARCQTGPSARGQPNLPSCGCADHPPRHSPPVLHSSCAFS